MTTDIEQPRNEGGCASFMALIILVVLLTCAIAAIAWMVNTKL